MTRRTAPITYLALLRGINVGGKRTIPMRDLAQVFVDAGFSSVETYIQSGNVLFMAGPETPFPESGLLEVQIEKRFGFHVPVVLRTRAQLADTVSRNPYLEGEADVDALHVLFLSDVPPPDAVPGPGRPPKSSRHVRRSRPGSLFAAPGRSGENEAHQRVL